MLFRTLADVVVIAHSGFLIFVIFGGLLTLRWPRAAWAHLPIVVYGMAIEFIGWVCPLTPLENWLRRLGGEAGYPDSFTEHYILPAIYPAGLTETLTTTLGISLFVFNALVYGWAFMRHRREIDKRARV